MLLNNNIEIKTDSVRLDEQDYNVLNIQLYTDDYTSTLSIFKNKDNLSVITDGDNEYVGYTNIRFFQGIEQDNITVINVSLVYEGLNKEIDALKEQLEESNNQISMLTDCLLEMSESIYE